MDNLVEKVNVLEQNDFELFEKYDDHEARINELEYIVDDYKRKERLNKLLLHGNVIVSTSPTLQSDIHKLFAEQLKLDAELIKDVRVIKFGTGAHSVLLEVPSLIVKKELFAAMKKLLQDSESENDNSAVFYLNEYLTPRYAELMKCCRERKKSKRIHSAFSFHGQVYIKISESANKKLIRAMSDIPS